MNHRRKVKTLNEDCRWSMPSCPSSPNQHHRPVFALRAPICPISQLSSQQMLLIEPWSRLPQDAVFELQLTTLLDIKEARPLVATWQQICLRARVDKLSQFNRQRERVAC